MTSLQEQFIAEARELIAQAIDDLIAMEREGPTSEQIDRIFRAFHTLKGSAGVVDLPAMSLTLHAAEDVLAALHSGRLAATSAITALASSPLLLSWPICFDNALRRACSASVSVCTRLRSASMDSNDARSKAKPRVSRPAMTAGRSRRSCWTSSMMRSRRYERPAFSHAGPPSSRRSRSGRR